MQHGKLFLYQPASGYAYNSDTIFLADFIRLFRPKGALLDVGCGVGILGLILRRHHDVRNYGVDIQPEMIAYAQHNFALNGFAFEGLCGDFVTDFPEDRRFDFIVSNPPFYHPDVDQSSDTKLNVARYAHHLPPETMIAKAKRLLKPRGYVIFCYDAKQIDSLLVWFHQAKLNVEALRFVHSKADRASKLVFIAARLNSKSMTKVMPPLIVFDTQSRYTPEALQAFENAATHSIKGEREGEWVV